MFFPLSRAAAGRWPKPRLQPATPCTKSCFSFASHHLKGRVGCSTPALWISRAACWINTEGHLVCVYLAALIFPKETPSSVTVSPGSADTEEGPFPILNALFGVTSFWPAKSLFCKSCWSISLPGCFCSCAEHSGTREPPCPLPQAVAGAGHPPSTPPILVRQEGKKKGDGDKELNAGWSQAWVQPPLAPLPSWSGNCFVCNSLICWNYCRFRKWAQSDQDFPWICRYFNSNVCVKLLSQELSREFGMYGKLHQEWFPTVGSGMRLSVQTRCWRIEPPTHTPACLPFGSRQSSLTDLIQPQGKLECCEEEHPPSYAQRSACRCFVNSLWYLPPSIPLPASRSLQRCFKAEGLLLSRVRAASAPFPGPCTPFPAPTTCPGQPRVPGRGHQPPCSLL